MDREEACDGPAPPAVTTQARSAGGRQQALEGNGMETKVVARQASWKNRLCGRCRRKLGSRARALSWCFTAPCAVVKSVAGRCSAWKVSNSSQTSEPSAKVLVQNGWSVPPWLSLEFGTIVQIEGTLVVRYRTQPWCWISLLGRCGFLRSMGISTSTMSDVPTFCGLQRSTLCCTMLWSALLVSCHVFSPPRGPFF